VLVGVDVLRLAQPATPAHERGNVTIDLRFATMMKMLGLPLREAHDALNDAVMAGLAFIKLRWLLGER